MKHYRVKQFSELTGVTVRSLQYYDDIGLLKSSARTDSAHRLYTEGDMLQLQQITTLKFMGFSLKKIREVLDNTNFDIARSLELQSEMLTDQANQLEKGLHLIRETHEMLKKTSTVNWQSIAKTIEVLTMKEQQTKEWGEKYFTPEELKQFEKLEGQFSPREMNNYHKKWEDLFNEVKSQLHTDPTSELGQALFKKWMALVDLAYKDFPKELQEKMWEAFKTGNVPKEQMPYYNQDVVNYIDEASQFFYSEK